MKCQEWTSRWEGTPWRPRAKAAGYLNKAPFSSISLLSHILGEAGREQCGKLVISKTIKITVKALESS